jgi:hypothetical protein
MDGLRIYNSNMFMKCMKAVFCEEEPEVIECPEDCSQCGPLTTIKEETEVEDAFPTKE